MSEVKVTRINVRGALFSLGGNTTILVKKKQDCFSQITGLEKVVGDTTSCKSVAYDATFSYLSSVKLPVLRHHLLAIGDFNTDAESDIKELKTLSPDLSGYVDTSLISQRIENTTKEISDLQKWLQEHPTAAKVAGPGVNLIIGSKKSSQQSLKNKLGDAQRYIQNASLYATSKTSAANLKKATKALKTVRFDVASGTYDLSGITDWSFGSQALDEHYWRTHNRAILDTYFVCDDEGNLKYIKPEMFELLSRLGPYIADGDLTMADFEQTLSNSEKYALFYLTLQLHDPVYGAVKWLFDAGQPLEGAIWWGVDILRSGLGETYSLPFGITEFLAFVGNGSHFTTSDAPGTIQSRSGFMDFYDPATALLGMDIETQIVVFESGGVEYRLQYWKGSYCWEDLFGGEIGLYYRDLNDAQARPYTPHKDLSLEELKRLMPTMTQQEIDNYFINYQCVPEGQQLPMVLEIYTQDGQRVLDNDTRDYAENGDHYWNFASTRNDNPRLTKDDIYIVTKLEVSDPTLRQDMYNALKKDGVNVVQNGDFLSITWGKQ
jgi:hypothetical protein